jgi:pimeloyl-ACP methyl ester carboxylesterase
MANKSLTLLLLLSSTLASPVLYGQPRSQRPFGTCTQLNISISTSSKGYIFDIPKVNNDLDATAWALNADTWSHKPFPEPVLQNTTISGTYNIHAQLCTPKSGGNVLQIASHGAFYDGRYWDAELQGHSYVNAALEAGYSILTYDRLGTGLSDKPDPYTVIQAQFELEILREMTLKARRGDLGIKPNKTVHVGHSFGSILTTAFIATYPSLTDGAIITGFVLNEHFGTVGRSSWAVVHPQGWPGGFVTMQKSGIQNTFFYGDFTQDLLNYGNSIKSPAAVGEITSGAFLATLGGPFTGPIHYILPASDFFICAGDCTRGYTADSVKAKFPNSSRIEIDIQPRTGHALPLHKNATAGFQVSFDFLKRNGL